MSDFSINIPSLYSIDACEDILRNNRWIENCIAKTSISNPKFVFNIDFTIGEVSCRCDDENEFKASTFGQIISVYQYSYSVYYGDDQHIYFVFSQPQHTTDNKNLFISCQDKLLLVEIVSLLNEYKETAEISAQQPEINKPMVKQNVDEDSGSSSIESNKHLPDEPEAQPKKASFWRRILDGIITNLVWLIIAAIVLAALAYFGITKPAWLNF